MIRKSAVRIVAGAVLALVPSGSAVLAGAALDSALTQYREQSGQDFSADRGRAFFLARPGSGKAETPSCTSCHGSSPLAGGQTRAGKPIEPMALSQTPERYAEAKKREKWFRRNCKSVLGRACSAQEKGDFLTFMRSQ
ncbi:MAG TPA: DUF1924 domain-containing protein [Alphaproteobacteria bacterium]|jgi:hypothetical protein|nr:DUF1924 domain-containing protein [Alphaproteobacteria bacterium]MDP6272097.1 DUF1924 domain-containing protein [Alphaproteobacteria bacterium]MDP7429510.1 DUF1924 domain-containing protein [Alphaproteobacteria bacterium]HJM51123.1 DUF1924 domain-containing protein [Alphaproteobacteria bacterium]